MQYKIEECDVECLTDTQPCYIFGTTCSEICFHPLFQRYNIRSVDICRVHPNIFHFRTKIGCIHRKEISLVFIPDLLTYFILSYLYINQEILTSTTVISTSRVRCLHSCFIPILFFSLSLLRETRSNKLFSFRRAKQGLISCSFMHGWSFLRDGDGVMLLGVCAWKMR